MRDLHKPVNAWQSLQFVVRKIHYLCFTQFATTLVFLGLLCFIIPGIILALMMPFVTFCSVPNSNNIAAIKQACQLVWVCGGTPWCAW